jgi:hypothetical protein
MEAHEPKKEKESEADATAGRLKPFNLLSNKFIGN